jgi:hypothetical protein
MAPEWRKCGEVCQRPGDGDGPALGVVQFERVRDVEGVGNYLTKYLAKGPANLPQWYVSMIDEGHNIRLRQASRGFFASLEKKPPKETKKRKEMPRGKTRSLEERLAACRHLADVYLQTEHLGDVPKDNEWVESTAYDFETCLSRLELSEEQESEIRKLGRCSVSADEFVAVAGVSAWDRVCKMLGEISDDVELPKGMEITDHYVLKLLELRGKRKH